MTKSILSAALFLFIGTSTALAADKAPTTTWNVDTSHSAANFSIRHMVVSKVRGSFTGVTGTVELNEKNFSKSNVDIAIDVATVDTGDEKRDGHLKTLTSLMSQSTPR